MMYDVDAKRRLRMLTGMERHHLSVARKSRVARTSVRYTLREGRA